MTIQVDPQTAIDEGDEPGGAGATDLKKVSQTEDRKALVFLDVAGPAAKRAKAISPSSSVPTLPSNRVLSPRLRSIS